MTILFLLWRLTFETHTRAAMVQIQSFTQMYQGAALADSFLLAEQCTGTAGCTLLKCAMLCASSWACKSLSFGVNERKCVHYTVLASDPFARDTKLQQPGWGTYQKDVDSGGKLIKQVRSKKFICITEETPVEKTPLPPPKKKELVLPPPPTPKYFTNV